MQYYSANQSRQGPRPYSVEDKIEFYKDIRMWHSKMDYQLFNLDDISSGMLTDNQKYAFMRGMLVHFNQELKVAPRGADLPVRYRFHYQIMQLLREASNIKSQSAQGDFIDRIYSWVVYEKGSKPPTAKKISENVDTSNLDNTGFATNDETQQIESRADKFDLPSKSANWELLDYNGNARTKHPQFDPPEIRLNGLKRRQLNFIGNKVQQELSSLVQNNSAKPVFQNLAPPETQIIQKKSKPTEDEFENPLVDISINDSDQPPQTLITLQPKIKTFLSDQQMEDKPRVLPFETRQVYQFYQPSNNEAELNNNTRWLQFRHRQLREKKEDEEIINNIKQWSKNKQKIDREIERRIDSKFNGSKYTLCEFRKSNDQTKQSDVPVVALNALPNIVVQTKAKIQEFQNIEQNITVARVNQAKNLYKNLLNLSTDQRDLETENPRSLSIYANKQRSNSMHNRFSNMLQSFSPSKVRDDQLGEIIDIKNRMAKHKLAVPIETLKAGIMIPEVEIYESEKLPQPGQFIMEDSLAPKDKKSKKKKKR